MEPMASPPEEFVLRHVTERCVNLSIHTAPITQIHRPLLSASARRDADVAPKRLYRANRANGPTLAVSTRMRYNEKQFAERTIRRATAKLAPRRMRDGSPDDLDLAKVRCSRVSPRERRLRKCSEPIT